MEKPISIVGAGISGLCAASWLSNNGRKVKIYERGSGIGLKRGQDFQVIRNYGVDKGFCDSLKKFNINIKHKHPINKIVKYAPSGRKMEVLSNNGPLFYVVKRGKSGVSLDNQIFESINKDNFEIEFNKNVNVLSGDLVSTGPVLRNIFGFGYTFYGIDIDPEVIHQFFDNRYAPNGYIYIAPFGKNTASIGCVSFDLNLELKIFLDRFIEDNKIAKSFTTGHEKKELFSGYGYCNFPDSAQINGKLFLGAAAGFVEGARGFGLKYSILSGLLAAKSIIENKSYDALWKNAFGKEIRDSLSRHFLLSNLDNAGYEKLVFDEKVSVNNYKKIPSGLSNIYEEIVLTKELKNWQSQYSLNKLF